jgi:site-specific DNA-methyltransferase (adenine-specific)
LYLKNQKLDRKFDEQIFFSEVKRVLKKDGFIVMFGRGTSFYRWNTILADLGFNFKEEIVWNKSYCSSPLMAISRVHETISIFTKGKGTINKVKVPYLEMKGHDIDGIITDIKKLKIAFKNTKSLDAILSFLENNKRDDRIYQEHFTKYGVNADNRKKGDRNVDALQGIKNGMNEKSIIRIDYQNRTNKYETTYSNKIKDTDRNANAMQSIFLGMNEKSIIKQSRDHYTTIHPTQKPVRLLERLLALVTKDGDVVLDPFSGSGSTAIACINTNRNFIGFEIDEEFYDSSINRIEKEMSLKLPELNFGT